MPGLLLMSQRLHWQTSAKDIDYSHSEIFGKGHLFRFDEQVWLLHWLIHEQDLPVFQ